MKYEVTYSCGHVGAVQIYGTAAEREKKIACYKKARQEEAATAAKQAKADGLPALTGSEKQIRWAESIRKEKMATAREWLARYPGEQADKCLAWYGGHASASWWIDHRDERPQRTAKLCVAEWLE